MSNPKQNSVIFSGPMRDWRIAEGEDLPDQHRVEYTVVIKKLGGTQFSLQIAPAGGDVEATPAMDVMIEINEGVPALHISPTQCGDNAANVYALPEGLVVGGGGDYPPEQTSSKRIWPHLPEQMLPLYK